MGARTGFRMPAAKAWNPEAHRTRKGQQWCFGMKLPVRVDGKTGLIHSMDTTAANMHNPNMLSDLLQAAVWDQVRRKPKGTICELQSRGEPGLSLLLWS